MTMTSSIADRSIPGFGGEIFAPGAAEYDEKRVQYAFSSYPEKQGPGGSMRPYLIAYPRMDSDDIPAAISFARANNKRLVARSGGHQYCGLSSGGDDTVLLSMDLYKHLELKTVGDKTLARVGVGTPLTDVAAAFKENGVTIPHGECPRVAIGGHAQSGGYGHLLRSYGLALDHVLEFKIYTSDGTLRTVHRPPAQDRSSLFWGVLGGGPGSFGILTEVTFECIRDADHRYSWGYQGFFGYEKSLFSRAVNEVKVWTEKIVSGDSAFPQDVDMEISLFADTPPGKPIIVIELVNGNRDGRNDQGRNRQFLEQTLRNITRGASGIPELGGYQGERALSFMADSFVRRRDFTSDGREFAEPYKKRMNCTKRPLSADFVDAFVDLADRVVNSGTVKLVIQILFGGGAYASPEVTPPLTSICHRDTAAMIVFDCFYTSNGLQDAERFQAEMEGLLGVFSGDQEVRMLWGSFGDTNIANETVRRCYYDDDTWRDLQKLKKEMDRDDLFHTEFTVQLP
jgi:FAD/FMN-containing dehydrogenase